MRCRELLDELSAYLDGELSGEVRRELELHLQDCHPCWVIVDTCRHTIAIYRAHPAPVLPQELHVRVRQAIETAARESLSGAPD